MPMNSMPLPMNNNQIPVNIQNNSLGRTNNGNNSLGRVSEVSIDEANRTKPTTARLNSQSSEKSQGHSTFSHSNNYPDEKSKLKGKSPEKDTKGNFVPSHSIMVKNFALRPIKLYDNNNKK